MKPNLRLSVGLVVVAGCIGDIGLAGAPTPTADSPTGMTAPGERLPGPASSGGCSGGKAAPLPLTALTATQYGNTVRDLLLPIDLTQLIQFADAGGRGFKPGVFLTSLEARQRL